MFIKVLLSSNVFLLLDYKTNVTSWYFVFAYTHRRPPFPDTIMTFEIPQIYEKQGVPAQLADFFLPLSDFHFLIIFAK